jgi:hypothetical protein
MSLKNQTHGLERVANNTLFLDTPPYLVSSADLQASIPTTNLYSQQRFQPRFPISFKGICLSERFPVYISAAGAPDRLI